MALPTALILARDSMTGALIGSLVDVSGFQPAYPRASEELDDAAAPVRPAVVLVDCDAPESDCDEVVARYGARVVLFSPSRRAPEVRAIAEQRRVPYFVLPISWTEFRRLLRAVALNSLSDQGQRRSVDDEPRSDRAPNV